MNKCLLSSLMVLSWALPFSANANEKTCCIEETCEHEVPTVERFKTVQEVVDYVMSVAPPQHLRTLKKHSQSSFLRLHFKLDDDFDQRLALKDGNQVLLDDAGAKNHRAAWRKIRIALWQELQDQH